MTWQLFTINASQHTDYSPVSNFCIFNFDTQKHGPIIYFP
jgi:hypothetical protein